MSSLRGLQDVSLEASTPWLAAKLTPRFRLSSYSSHRPGPRALRASQPGDIALLTWHRVRMTEADLMTLLELTSSDDTAGEMEGIFEQSHLNFVARISHTRIRQRRCP